MKPPRDPRRGEIHGSADPDELRRLVADSATVTIEARGTWCPEPLLRLQRAAADAEDGTVFALVADDPGVELDVPAWCISSGNEYLGTLHSGSELASLARRRKAAAANQPNR